MRNEKGFSIIEAMVAAVIIAITVGGLSTLMAAQLKASQAITHGLDILDLRSQLQTVLANSQNCGCQLNPDLSTDDANDPNLTFDPTVIDGSNTLNLRSIRAGCSATSPMIVQANQNLGNGFQITSLDFAELRPTGSPNQWQGTWRVSIADTNGNAIRGFEHHQVVNTRLVSPTQAVVNTCQGTNSPTGLAGCPSGMAMIGGAGLIGSYCIDVQPRPASGFREAKTACGTAAVGYGPAHLCDHNEWFAGCRSGLMENMSNGEQVADFDGTSTMVTAGPGVHSSSPGVACSQAGWTYLTSARAFRCCIR